MRYPGCSWHSTATQERLTDHVLTGSQAIHLSFRDYGSVSSRHVKRGVQSSNQTHRRHFRAQKTEPFFSHDRLVTGEYPTSKLPFKGQRKPSTQREGHAFMEPFLNCPAIIERCLTLLKVAPIPSSWITFAAFSCASIVPCRVQ